MKTADLRLPRSPWPGWETALDVLVQTSIFFYIAGYFSPEHLLSKTTTTGGDSASHYYTAQFLKDYLLPHGKILGWMQGNYAGFPVFQFYFPMPFLLMVALSYVTGLQIAFKVVSVLGIFMLPVCTYFGFRLLGFRFPAPALASLAALPFLFMEANSMWGGNILSTLAGEFTYSIGFALMVLFAGTCYRGIRENRWAIANGVLLALIGFNHGYTLLFAVAFSSYFLIALPGLARNLRYLATVHGLAFCLMGFWIVPLLGYSAFTTRYNVVWVINSWQEILPPILWPGIALAAAFTLYKLVRMAWPRWREPFEHRVGLLWYLIGMSYLFYLIAFRIHVVDIRFLPFLQFFLGLLGAVPLGLLALRMKAGWLLVAVIGLGSLLWVDSHVSFTRQWIAWNYSGFERKTLWPAFSGVNQALRGSEADARVVYEHSAEHNAAGTVRAFESLPLFSGRNTLEGLYMQSSISSPFVFYLQSEISEVASCALPDYHCAIQNLAHGAEHLRLFNVGDFIVRSDAIKRAIRNSPEFELRDSIAPYEIYRVKGNEGRYVVPLQYQPVLLQTQDWKMDFYSWFKRPGTSAVPLVHLFDADSADTGRFALKSPGLPLDIPKRALEAGVQVTEQVSQEEIRIHTSRIGHPLLVKISYHPRWRVEGADKIYLASPSFMLIYPTQTEVRLVFGDPPMVRFGHLLTLLAWTFVFASFNPLRRLLAPLWTRIVAAQSRLTASRAASMAAASCLWYDAHRARLAPWLVGLAAAASLLFAFSLQQTDSSVLYNKGLDQFTQQRCDLAAPLFEKAIEQNPNSTAAINASYYYAICFFKQRQWEKAIELFSGMIGKFPDSMYVPEALYHIGLSLQNLGRKAEAAAKLSSIVSDYPASPWAGHARAQLDSAGPSVAALPPTGARAEFAAAIKLFDANQLQPAGEAFRAIAHKYPNDDLADDAYMYLCFTLFRREMYAQAIQELRIMLRRFPGSPWIVEARYHVGASLMRTGQQTQALPEFEWVIRKAPNSDWAARSRDRIREIKR